MTLTPRPTDVVRVLHDAGINLPDTILRPVLLALVAERRDAYLDGLLERKMASVAVSQAANWREVIAYNTAVEHRIKRQP